jgi:hypothetical protein
LFSKHQNKAEFNNLDDFNILSGDFPGFITSTASMASTASTASVASMTYTTSFHQKNADTDGWIIPGTTMMHSFDIHYRQESE